MQLACWLCCPGVGCCSCWSAVEPSRRLAGTQLQGLWHADTHCCEHCGHSTCKARHSCLNEPSKANTDDGGVKLEEWWSQAEQTCARSIASTRCNMLQSSGSRGAWVHSLTVVYVLIRSGNQLNFRASKVSPSPQIYFWRCRIVFGTFEWLCRLPAASSSRP